MIDKPKGRVEYYLEKIFDRCRKGVFRIKTLLEKPFALINKKKNAHPRMAKAIIAATCILVMGLVVVGFASPKDVTVVIDDSVQNILTEYETTCFRVDSFIEDHKIDYEHGKDIIDVDLQDGIEDGMKIHITKAFDVTVHADGKKHKVNTLPVTAGELLDQLGIEVGEDDIVTPELSEQISKDQKVVVERVTVDYETKTVKTPFEVKYKADPTLVIGDTKVKQKGRNGITEKTYRVIYVDGKKVSRTLDSSEVKKKKRNKIINYGTKILKGIPKGLKYVDKFTSVRAVSYYFSGNPRGAYGGLCKYGTCAVDEDLIPLGSLLYIEGYGYAVANDVGGAIKGKTVDLYMEKYSQCITWGSRSVNVYVIKYNK